MVETLPYTNDIEGWMFPAELAWLYETAKRMMSIAEVGCWKGRSTHALLSGCPGIVYAVDHFQGSKGEPGHDEARNGVGIRSQFMQNVGDFRNLRMIERDSLAAASMFADGELDMVFIDAGHTYEEVSADIRAWRPKARRLICGHDYAPVDWPGVVRAVHERLIAPDGVDFTIWWKEL